MVITSLLKIDSLRVNGYQYELTARFTEPAKYFLIYGNRHTARPDYDIACFVKNIPEGLTVLSLGKEEVINQADGQSTFSLFENKNWLWGIIGIIILFLAWFSISMLKKKV